MPQRNFFRTLSTLGVALLSLWGAGMPAAWGVPTATITPILPLGTDVTTTALAVSADGNVVVGQSNITPVVWEDGNTTAFNGTGNSTSIVPTAVNNAGNIAIVVGGSLTNGQSLPFIYNATAGNFTTIKPFGSDQGATAVGIGDTGEVAINGFGTNVTVFTSYIYDPATGNSTTLGGLGAVSGLSENSVNLPYLDSGTKTAGIYNRSAIIKKTSTAPTLSGNYSYSEVDGISPLGGYVVGVASNNATVGQTLRKGFFYDSTGANATVLAPFNPGDVFAVCRTVSSNITSGPLGGGASGTASSFGNERAVLFDIGLNATLDLKQLLKDLYGLDISPNTTTAGWTSLNEVHSISADGLTIVGDGIYSENSTVTGARLGFVVTLNFAPQDAKTGLTIVAQPTDTAVSINTNATFVAEAIPGGSDKAISYQWFKVGSSGNTSVHNAVGSTLVITAAQPTNAGDYYCNITNSTGTLSTNTAHLTVNGKLPKIDLSPSNTTLKVGSKFTLTANLTGAGDGQPSSYQWSLNGTTITGATKSKYTVAKATRTSGGNYTVQIVSPLYGNITSSAKLVNVLYPPSVTTQPAAVTVTAGQPAQLIVVATGNPKPTYQWYIHNRAITARPSAKDPILNFNITHTPDSNIYRVRVTNSQGSVYSNYANLTVNPINPNGNSGGGNTTGGNTTGGNTTGG